MKRSRILREVDETMTALRRSAVVNKRTMQIPNPPHPGEVLKETVLRPDGGITIAEFARRLGCRVSRSPA